MTADRWQTVRALFDEGRGLDVEARAAWLDGLDADLRAAVAPLLEADAEIEADGPTGFLVVPAADRAPGLFDGAEDAHVGRRVGPWRLEERIGEGGMGVVYRAVRADADFRQEAALKVVGRGLAPRALLERFRQERRILAGLEHPGIARLLDGGLSEDGQPYFAMELVRGEPLTAYAEARGMGLEARVRLLADVCDAVAYAHRNLVVHRDLKPSNVLVAEGDEGRGARGMGHEAERGPTAPHAPSPRPYAPRVKLLDFGIATVLEADGGADLRTRTGALLTPAYAAPEQVRGGRVTTATDVYALGVLLFELLTGRRPASLEAGASPTAVERAVCERPAPRPSAVAPEARRRAIRGDLDTIVLKALEKDPARRYASAEALGTDLRRHLAGLPVEARRATVGYRAASFVRRHPVAVGLATVAALALVLGLAGTTWQARVAAAERDRARQAAATAEQTADFLAGLFAASDPLEPAAEGDTLTARTLLLRGAERLRSGLEAQPAVRAALLARVGVSLRGLGQYAAADSLLREAEAAQRGLDDPAALATTLYERSLTLDRLGDYDGTTATAAEALALRRAALAPDDPDLAQAMDWMATVHEWNGQPDSARALERDAVARLEAAVPPGDDRLLQARHNLGWMLVRQGDPAAAAPVFEAAVRDARAADPDHPEIPRTLAEWAVALRQLGRLDEAEALYREALEAQRARFGPDHLQVGLTLSNLARVPLERGDLEAAEADYVEALGIFRARLGPGAYEGGVALTHLATVARRRGDLGTAERRAREALAVHRAAFPEGSAFEASTRVELARVLLARGRGLEAARHARAALAQREAELGPDHATTAEARALVAEAGGGATGRP